MRNPNSCLLARRPRTFQVLTLNLRTADHVPGAPEASFARTRNHIVSAGSVLVVNIEGLTVWARMRGAGNEFESSIWYVFNPSLASCKTAMSAEQKAIDTARKSLKDPLNEVVQAEGLLRRVPGPRVGGRGQRRALRAVHERVSVRLRERR